MSSSGSNAKNAVGSDSNNPGAAPNTNNNNTATSSRQQDAASEASSDGAPLSMSLTSDEVNYLVFRYAAFRHSSQPFLLVGVSIVVP